jgi:Domain of unknown function (DUF4198)
MTLQVGHGAFRQRSPILARRIIRFQAIAPNGAVVDLHDQLQLGQPAQDGDFRFTTPGAYFLVLQTDDRAQTQLPSIRFNDYLRVEGLTPALLQRARLKQMDRDGSERYSRCARAVVQVGPAGEGSQGQISKPVGLPLEIVPEAYAGREFHDAYLRFVASERDMDQSIAPYRGDGLRNCILQFEFRVSARSPLRPGGTI